MFLDIAALSEQQTDLALGFIYKAYHGHDDDDAIWDDHPSPMVRKLVELFTQRGLNRLEAARAELIAFLNGERVKPTVPPRRPAGAADRWTPAETQLVQLYLESLPPDQWALDDHMLLVDWMMQKHLGPAALKTEAEWLAVRSALMGRLQAAMGELEARQANEFAARMPNTVQGSNTAGVLRQVVELAANRAAEHVTALADGARHEMRGILARGVERQLAGDLSGPSVQTQLNDAFGALNRDWRRIAVTEATEALGQGFVAAQEVGTRLRRVEQYRNACAWCRKIDGLVVTVVDAAAEDKDGATQVWPGKNNVGRSAAPRKRVGNRLVEREPDEMWWPAAGAQHPHCRGRWLPVIEDLPGQDSGFGDWLRLTLGKPQEKAP